MLSISPREAWLEREYSKTKAELDYLRRQAPRSYDLSEPAQHMQVECLRDTLQIAQVGCMERNPEGGLHVLCYETHRFDKPLKVGYYLDAFTMKQFSTAERAARLASLHEEMVFEIGHKFWSET